MAKPAAALARKGIEQLRAAQLGQARVLPSLGNFALIDCGRLSTPLYEQLLRKGVIVRPMAAWGLPNYLRVSVAATADMPRVIEALASVFA